MMIENVLFIWKQFGDSNDGITAYLRKLCSSYSEKKMRLQIMTTNQKAEPQDADVIRVEGEWNLFSLPTLVKATKTSEAELLNLHYIPQAYARLGMSLAITLWFVYSRIVLKKRVVISFHEVYEPFSLKSFWRLPIALLSRIQFFLFLMIAHQVIFTTPVHRARVLPFFPFWKSKMHFVPVYSNLDYVKLDDGIKTQVREKWGIHSDETVLGLFSKTLHSELKIEKMIEVAYCLKEKGIAAKMLLIGALRDSNPEEFQRLEKLAEEKQVKLVWTGALSADKLSETLQILDHYLFLSPDGVSPRSSTVMAALQHELHVITVPSPQMKDYPDFSESVSLLEQGTPDEVVKIITEDHHKQESNDFYKRYFSPEIISDAVINIFGKDC